MATVTDSRSMTFRTISAFAAAVGLAFIDGCGSDPQAGPVAEPSPIEQVGQLLRSSYEMGKTAPKTLKEAEKSPGVSPKALEALKSGDVAIYWGANLDEYGAASMIGHEKDAPGRGGRVILGDGTVVELTADQIRGLPHPPDALLKPGAAGRAKGSR